MIESGTGEAGLRLLRNDRVGIGVTIVNIILPDGDVEALAEANRQKANITMMKPFTGGILARVTQRYLRATDTTA